MRRITHLLYLYGCLRPFDNGSHHSHPDEIIRALKLLGCRYIHMGKLEGSRMLTRSGPDEDRSRVLSLADRTSAVQYLRQLEGKIRATSHELLPKSFVRCRCSRL